MEITWKTLDHILMVKICGDIDHHTCEMLRQQVDQALESTNSRSILFSFHKYHLWTVPALACSLDGINWYSVWAAELPLLAPVIALERFFVYLPLINFFRFLKQKKPLLRI